ncbi:YraN family protein [Rufibacter roseus]|uniref:UPF0102 protein ACFQHR_01750 n=1 Tax=Rufibacter roseus TaxID=1567108 RepID=A0ABW2DIX4_9BACT|nr:YraN family protein [Rufibacter roseus]
MAHNTRLGQQGEDAAEAYLRAKGYQVLSRNYRYRRAEVDLIAVKDKILVLVEVKTRSTHYFGYPEEAVTPAKEELLLMAADNYIEETNWQHDVRFDIISILWQKSGPMIWHFEDAFH